MKILYVGRQVEVTEDLKYLVEKKLAKFDRYFPREADATVTFRKVRDWERLEITVSVDGTLIRAEEQADKFSTALTRCIDILEGQIRRNKTRLEKQLRSSFVRPASEGTIADSEEDDAFRIRTKRFTLKPMTAEEAILQMNLLGHSFFLFADADTGETAVVYKRNDGAYGLILPDKNAESVL